MTACASFWVNIYNYLAINASACQLSPQERVRVRGFARRLGILTPALSQRAREQRPLTQKTVKFMSMLH
jgi:hypothetical protein